ncbi:hypothetical protein PV325_000076 [Microctonus aethiopoides]|nr:hypothetical protein PV325_000076 [Microctonus aethiopoides]
MNYNENKCLDLENEYPPIDPTFLATNASSDFLKADYATCTSSGPISDQYDAINQSSKNYRRPRTCQTIINKIPINRFRRSTVSCKDIARISSEISKQLQPSAVPMSTLQSSHWSKFKRTRRGKPENSYKFGKPNTELTHSNFNSSKKLYQKNIQQQGILSEIPMSHKDNKMQILNDKEKNFVDEECLQSNQSDITRTNADIKPEKYDIYYFDHGNSEYYLTTDINPILLSDKCADKIDNAAIRFWAEIFGTIHIGITFITAFLLQFLRFVLRSILKPLIVGVIQMISDYVFKPFLTIIYNGVIQPLLIFLFNIASSFRDLCEPIAEAMGYFFREFANLFRAIRLIEINPQTITKNHHHVPMNEQT